jgi:hypothetical protein
MLAIAGNGAVLGAVFLAREAKNPPALFPVPIF